MEFVAELFKAIIIDTLLAFPGAFIRWLFLHKRRSYISLLDDIEINALITVIAMLFVFGIVTLCKHYI